MALSKTISIPSIKTTRAGSFSAVEESTFDMGVCYIKVTSYSSEGGTTTLNGVKVPAAMRFNVDITNDAGQKAEQSFFFEPSFDDADGNFIKQAYVFLKTIPDFSGATDV
jgi:hypothetical protein